MEDAHPFPPRHAGWQGLPLYLVTAVTGLLLMVRWYPLFIQTQSGDTAVGFSYNPLFWSGFKCGKDLLCVHGPWGIFFWQIYDPNTYGIVVATHVWIALTCVAISCEWALRFLKSAVVQFVFVIALILLFSISIDCRVFALATFAILLAGEKSDQTKYGYLVIVFTLGFLSLTKSSFLIVGIATTFLIGLIETFIQRRWPVGLAIYLGSIVLFAAVARHDVVSLFSHVAETVLFSFAYNESFSEFGPLEELLVFMALSAAYLLTTLLLEIRIVGKGGLLIVTGCAAVLFLAYKAGFSRHDGQHALIGYCALLAMAAIHGARLLAAPENAAFFSRLRLQKTLMLALYGFGMAGAILVAFFFLRVPSFYQAKVQAVTRNVVAAGQVLSGQDNFAQVHEAAKSSIRAEFPLPSISGEVAIWSLKQTVGYAHDLNVRPTPVVGVNHQIMRALARANVEYLSGAGAPKELLIDFPWVDADFNSNGPATLAMLAHYRLVGETGTFLHLLRRSSPRPIGVAQASSITAQLNKPVDIPADGGDLVWLTIDVKRSLPGILAGMLYKVPAIVLELHYETAIVTSRLNLNLAAEGMLIMPQGKGIRSLFAQAASAGAGGRVKGITVRGDGFASWFCKLEIGMTVSRVTLMPEN